MAVINTFSAGMPSNIGTWNLRSDSPTFRITAHQLVGGAVEVYFSTTAGRINWDYWTLMNPSTRFPKWFLDAATFISHPKSECTVTITFPLSTVMVINFGAPGANLPPPQVPIVTTSVTVTASATPWSTPTTMSIDFKKYGDVAWLTIPSMAKNGSIDTTTISFNFPGGEWPAGFKPRPGQRFPFHGPYGNILNTFVQNDKGNISTTMSFETTPLFGFNVLRIDAPCLFDSPSTWQVTWPTHTFCYMIDPSV